MAEAEIVPESSPVAAEESTAPDDAISAPEASPPAKETAPGDDESNPKDGDEEPAAEAPEEADGAAPNDHKRKLEDLEPADEGEEEKKPEGEASEAADEGRSDGGESGACDAKRPRLDGEADGLAADGGNEVQNLEAPPLVNGQHPPVEDAQATPVEPQEFAPEVSQHDSLTSAGQQPTTGLASSSRKIEVPNNKVGVLIGKAGDTIKYLQYNSGAKIQITRDAEADPHSSTRPVELIGSLESINKAEQLIRDVIAEADAGGSPALVARGFGTVQSGAEQTEIQVPNEKVGLVIGKGGETIKNLQTRSGARIQLIPQHLPEGDSSKERTVRISGNRKQIEAAKEMIKNVISQAPLRSAPQAGGYNQQAYPPRGVATLPQWGPRPQPPSQLAPGYDYQQRGTYPPQTTQYPSQPYGSYPQQAPSRSSLGTSWDQRPPAPVQTPQTGSYDYYKQGGQALDAQPSNHAPAPAPAPASGPVNYNYGQSQAGYGQPAPYAQSIPSQQNYGHGYNEPKYDTQAPSQQMYGQPVSSQPGVYAQQITAPQSGYPQQQEPYSKPVYGGVPQSYGPPRASQPGDAMYQGPVPSPYGSGAPTQQSYPYGSGAAAQSAPAYGQTYGPTSGSVDGYAQPSPAGYSQTGGQVPSGYGQGGQPVQAYTQQGQQSGGYGQYPSSQPSYGDQSAPSNVNYGYQGGSADGVYGSSLQSSGYGAAPVSSQPGYGQAGYVQPPSNVSGYDQSSQPGYGGPAGGAMAGYTKGVSPQPGYGGQYDSVQMYGHH